MGVFDALVIANSSGEVAELARPVGPIEQITQPGATAPEQVLTTGFGIDPSGDPYYDSVAVDPGDEATLYVDARTVQVWLEAA